MPVPERGDQRLDFAVAEHLVEARFFDVENLALERKDCLVLSIAALLGGTAGRVALNDVDLGKRRDLVPDSRPVCPATSIAPRAPLRTISRALRAASRARAASSALPTIFRATGGFCSKIFSQTLIQERLDRAFHVGIELAFRLALKLRLRQLHGNHRHETFAHIVAGQRTLEVLRQAGRLRVGVDRSGKRRAKSGEVRAAVDSVDVVGKRIDLFVVAVVVLNRHFNRQGIAFLLEIERLVVKRGLVLVQMFDELRDPALVVKLV